MVLIGFCAVASAAEPVSELTTETDQLRTPAYSPRTFYPQLGSYKYKVSWQGIPAATLTVNVEKEGLRYHIDTKAKTYRGIDIFYKLRYNAKGVISAVDYSPLTSEFELRENSRHKTAKINFLPNGDIHAYRTRKGRDDVEIKFNPKNGTLDPFSSAFLARSLKWKLGETKTFDTYNGKSRYMISLTAVDKTEMSVNGVKKPVWVVSPKVEKLGNKKKNKLRKAWIYVTADKAREILQIKSEVFIGSVKTRLVSYTPSSRPNRGPTLAAKRTGETEIKLR